MLERHVATLKRTPGVIQSLLGGLDEAWVRRRYTGDGFSPYHVVGHLIIGEQTDWIPRARIILEHGPARPFDPFDQQATIEPGPPLAELLETFGRLRADNLAALASMGLDASRLALEGEHPALGRVTLAQLIATWATHDLHHIAQITKGLADQNRDEVGPWRDWIGIIPAAPIG